MRFYDVVDRLVTLLRERGRVTHRGLKGKFEIADACVEERKDELINAQRLAVDEEASWRPASSTRNSSTRVCSSATWSRSG